jgi:3-isopropylmalate/(R)-2-methylmalate dehydratase small subunit
MEERITGRVWKFGDDVNTDIIFPGKYTYTISEPEEMARHAMEDADPEFAKNVQRGDIVVAGKNFGCGSSREQAATCLRAAGVGAVVAKSFARIYFRNAINLGLPIVQCPEVVDQVKAGDELTIDFRNNVIEHNGKHYPFPSFADSVLAILRAGGLIPYVTEKLSRTTSQNA